MEIKIIKMKTQMMMKKKNYQKNWNKAKMKFKLFVMLLMMEKIFPNSSKVQLKIREEC